MDPSSWARRNYFAYHIPRSRVRIVRGETSRRKVVEIIDV